MKLVKCPRCSKKTSGKLFRLGSVNLCQDCAISPDVKDAAEMTNQKIRRVR